MLSTGFGAEKRAGISPEGAGIRITPTTPNPIMGMVVEIHTDGGKLNRLNAHRNPRLLKDYPDHFGAGKEFPPLISAECSAEGRLTIECHPTGGITEIDIPNASIIEVWPKYDLDRLEENESLVEEIKILWKGLGKKKETISRSVPWSGPRDLFLTKKRMPDLVVLAMQQKTHWPDREAALEELNALLHSPISYTPPENKEGWQQIRTPAEIKLEKKANCLDLTLWVTAKAFHSGWTSKIAILGDHSIAVLGDEKPVMLETTTMVSNPKGHKAGSLKEVADYGKKEFLRKLKENPDNSQEITIGAWCKMFELANHAAQKKSQKSAD